MDHTDFIFTRPVRGDYCCSDSEERLDRSSTYWGRGRFRGNRSDVGTQEMDKARVRPYDEVNPRDEPQPRAAPRPHKSDNHRKNRDVPKIGTFSDTSRRRFEDYEGYVVEVYDEGLD